MNLNISSILAQHNDVIKQYPFKATSYFLSLINKKGDGIYNQIIPSPLELKKKGLEDPLAEIFYSPVEGLVHRYPNRVLLLTTNQCFGYCRFCTRKRNWDKENFFFQNFDKIFSYVSNHTEISEIIVSGGDPLVLDPSKITAIFNAMDRIPHIQIVRIGSRILSFQPNKITDTFLKPIKFHGSIFFLTHFNHPNEITETTKQAVQKIIQHNIILFNQSVLLKGINDSQEVLEKLSLKLLSLGIKPYALHQLDKTISIQHFKVPINYGRMLIKTMRQTFTGIGIPHYVLDKPKGKGKVFL